MKFFEMKNPFAGLNTSEREKLVHDIGQQFKKEVDDGLGELKTILKSYSIVDLLSWLSTYFLTSISSKFYEKFDLKEFHQFHAEILQALYLQYEKNEFKEWKPVLPDDAIKISELVDKVSFAFANLRLSEVKLDDEDEMKRFLFLEKMRTMTMSIRNWGYPEQIDKIVTEIYSEIDSEILEETSISIIGIFNMFTSIQSKVNDNINIHFDGINKILGSDSIEALRSNYKILHKDVELDLNELEKLQSEYGDFNKLKSMFAYHHDSFLRDKYTFTISELLDFYGNEIDKDLMINVLDNFSYTIGGLKDYRTEYIFLANPIWKKPFIKIDSETYALPIPGILNSFVLELLESIFSKNSKLKKLYEDRRAEFLENAISDLFKSSFPDCEVFQGSLYDEYENDLTVIVDKYAFVVEAKSGKFTDPAKRGAPDRLKKHIEELISEPSIQATRFAEYLQQQNTVVTLNTKSGIKNTIDLSNVSRVVKIGVTLELLGNLSSSYKQMYELGFISDFKDLSINFCFPDLYLIFDFLKFPSEKIHFLIRREEFGKNANFFADEIDLLAFYMETGFNIGDEEFNGRELMLYGISEVFDDYFLQRQLSSTSSSAYTPKPKRTKWFNDILKRFESKKFPGWTEISMNILNLSYEDQVKFEEMFRKRIETSKLNWGNEDNENTVVLYNGPPQRRELLIGFAYKDWVKSKRDDIIGTFAQKVMEEENLPRAVVLVVNIEQNHYPYSCMMVFLNSRLNTEQI